MKSGLILEGGGMRGMYTAGILDCFMEEGITFDYVIGSSSGVCNAVNFVSGQIGRSKKIMLLSKKDSYAGVRELLLHGSFLNLKKLFKIYPYREDLKFDFDTYFTSTIENEFVVSDCHTGKPKYLSEKSDEERLAMLGMASCSLPLISKPVKAEGTYYMDGSMTDPIPLQHTMDKGCERIVLISTKGEGMEPSDMGKYKVAMRILYGKKFVPFITALSNRLDLYYKQWDMVYEKEKEGTLKLLQPQGEVAISHLETDREKLREMYESGYKYGKTKVEEMKQFLR